MREQNRAYTLFLKWIGFRQAAIDIESDERYAGKSSYNFKRKINMAAQFITAQSNKPLFLSIRVGMILAFISFLFIIWQVVKYFFTDHVVSGWTSMIVSMYFLGGVMLIFMGVLGVYIGYVFNEVKQRPLYIVRTVLNKDMLKDGENANEQIGANAEYRP
jgi:dolichol-phosphate mannosyltransferase